MNKKHEILSAAINTFAEYGYYGATMDEIASRAGVTKGALYWHYANKRDLFLAVFQYAFVEIDIITEDILRGEGSVWDRLEAGVSAYLEYYQNNPDLISLLRTMVFEGKDADDADLIALIKEAYSRNLELLEEVIKEGIAKGEFRSDLDIKGVVRIVSAMFDGVMFQSLLFENYNLMEMKEPILRMIGSNVVEGYVNA